MPLLNFTTSKEKILAGEKVITVRKRAKDQRWAKLKLKDPLYLYWKLRTKASEKLFPSQPHKLCGMIRRPVLTIQPWESLYALEGVNEGLTLEWTETLGYRVYIEFGAYENQLGKEGVVIPTGKPYKRVFIPEWKRRELLRLQQSDQEDYEDC